MYEYRVKKVNKIVDGDTFDVDLDLGFNISYSQRVRLAGIDSPESRTRDLAEKALGLESKDFLKKAVDASSFIVIKTEKPDSTEKYGRVLGWVYLDNSDKSINQIMIDLGYAWEYLGATKEKDFGALKAKRESYKGGN
jgi:micrococcal nuclease